MLTQFSRTELVFGKEGVETLKRKTVAVLGAGGVGSFAMEALARTGIGRLILIDKDVVDITNVNRQIPALVTTVGRPKVEVMKERIAQINPDCEVIALQTFFLEDTKEQLFAHSLDYVVDAIDIVTAKILLIKECVQRNIPIVSSMGAANKIDPTRFRVMDLADTRIDPIAKVLRRELKKYGITRGVKTVCSTERPRKPREDVRRQIVSPEAAQSPVRKAKMPPASTAYVPSVAGLILASVVIHDLTGVHPEA
ncbi:tRNA threonylcarbamoyladenosine dehydratase [Alicyclobacillus contaminans]|uniref:tRNA threonylcarbamoyladenosine dehydratase n=1 Tax=Alicyclobacillus contaminans TaxID=392016 RepID=UPI00047DD921|nr:tRNA threonylcarbamoyladenosine dehydratase [Alicyclobacillus contaminans]